MEIQKHNKTLYMKPKMSRSSIVLGILCVISGIKFYSSEWSFKYEQPISKIGAIAIVNFGIVLLIFEIIKFFKIRKS